MCGLAGLVGGGDSAAASVNRMVSALRHRGPDSGGVWRDADVALGHTRLRVLDLSDSGQQPMTSANRRFTIVYNGETYNYRSLRDQLRDRGHSFRSQTDTEVVLAAWAEWGPGCLRRLDGMFAFAVWDNVRRVLSLARDRMGIKPLYYSRGSETFTFASEVGALLASEEVPRKLDTSVLHLFLSQQTVPTPRTLVEGVRMVPPAHWMEVSTGASTRAEPLLSRYWHPLSVPSTFRSADPDGGQPEVPQTLETLTSAVERRLVSDVPLGAFLSGGADSTSIVALMSRASHEPVRTFTVVLDEPGYEDGHYARLAAEHFRTEHVEIPLGDHDLVERIPTALAAQDHPSGDGINTWIVSVGARRAGLTVALSGIGGDELFGGYSTFPRLALARRGATLYRWFPRPIRTGLGQIARLAHPSVLTDKACALLATGGTVEEAYPILREVYPRYMRERLIQIRDEPAAPGYGEFLRSTFQEFPAATANRRAAFAELSCYMHDVLLRDTDQMSMSQSLEIRVPFLDTALVEHVFALPDSALYARGATKHLLRAATADLLPGEIRSRPKSGFALPFDRWIRGPLLHLCEDALEPLADHRAFDGSAVLDSWRSYLAGSRRLTWSRLWLLVALGTWMRRESIR